jgi:hypothetical protein
MQKLFKAGIITLRNFLTCVSFLSIPVSSFILAAASPIDFGGFSLKQVSILPENSCKSLCGR